MSAATQTPKPTALTVDFSGIPKDLKAEHRFVVWNYKWKSDKKGVYKWTKPPYQARNPKKLAATDNPQTWGTFDEARAAYERGECDGIGYVLIKDDDLFGVDLDHCVDPITNEISSDALEVIATLDSCTTLSPSGTGVRILALGKLPPEERKKDNFEVYESGRYLTLTGHTVGAERPIAARQPQLEDVHRRVFGKVRKSDQSENGDAQPSNSVDDEIRLGRMFASKNGAAIKALMDGDTSAYGSHSEADLALVSHLGFWFDYDPDLVDEQFRLSGLYRTKWDTKHSSDGQTYGLMTIAKAFKGKGRGDGYNGENSNGENKNGFKGDDHTTQDDGATAAKMQDHEVDPERIAQEITDFPLEVYPERLVLFIKAAAAALPAPPDFLAVAMLATLGSAIGISREIKLKDSWREGARFFVAIVADPGSKKSPALALATAPLKELQRAYNKDHRKTLEEYERKKQEYEKAKADKRNSGDTLEPPGAEPELAQCLTTDATVEALMSLHVKNPRALMLYQDELSGWVSGMGQYKGGKGNDLQKWLSIWSGAQVIVNRKGKQAEVLDDPFINVAGCIPPDILPTLETSEGSDGFIDRILFCYPRGVQPTFNPNDDIPRELTLEYQKVFNTLRSLEPNEGDGTPQPKTLEMTPEALKLFTAWANDHHEENNAPGFDRRLRGAWAKLEGYCTRFALVLHLTAYAASEESDERISLTSISKAAALTDYFKSHARRVYGQLKGDPLDKMLRTVYEYIDQQPGRRCVPRDLTRARMPGCTTAKSTKALLQKLTDAGLGQLETITHLNGRKGEAYVLVAK